MRYSARSSPPHVRSISRSLVVLVLSLCECTYARDKLKGWDGLSSSERTWCNKWGEDTVQQNTNMQLNRYYNSSLISLGPPAPFQCLFHLAVFFCVTRSTLSGGTGDVGMGGPSILAGIVASVTAVCISLFVISRLFKVVALYLDGDEKYTNTKFRWATCQSNFFLLSCPNNKPPWNLCSVMWNQSYGFWLLLKFV